MLPEIDVSGVSSECKSTTPPRIVEEIAEYRKIASEALTRVSDEGTVVRTLKGDVIAHPGIRIHADAAKAEAALLKVWAVGSY